MNDNAYINSNRFFGSNTKTAAEIQDELDALRNNGIPARVSVISLYDIFSDDESKHAPGKYHLTNVTSNGKAIAFKDIVRGIATKIGGEHSNADDFRDLAEYFMFLSDSLNSVSDKAEKNKELNDQVRQNNLALEIAKSVLDSQRNHEANLSPADWAGIARDEETQNVIKNLQADNAALKSEQSLISKTIAALTLKKKPAAKKTTTK